MIVTTVLTGRFGRCLAAVVVACGLLAAAAAGDGIYVSLTRRAPAMAPTPLARLTDGDLIGRILAKRVGLDTPVYEGVGLVALSQAAGHLPGTALPGMTSNSVIAVAGGDRGSRVARLRLGDTVVMRTPFGLKHYLVVERRLLDPADLQFEATRRSRVTLLTPYPCDGLGPAPARLALALEESSGASKPASAFRFRLPLPVFGLPAG